MPSKVVSSLALLAISACAAPTKPYLIGAAGPWKQGYGLQNLQGVELAVEEINTTGGINGHPLRVVSRDDEGDGEKATKIAQDFVSTRAIAAVIGHVNSSGMLAAAPVYDAGELPAIATSATSPDLTGISSWVFRIISSDSLNGIALANFASKFGSRGPASVSVLYENNTYGRGLADAFRRSFHGDILSLDPINADMTSAEPYVAYLKTRKPKIVFVAGRVASGLKILQEAKRQGFNPIFLGGDGWQGILTDTATSEGAYIGMSFTPEDPSQAARTFVAAFERKYHTTPDAHAALAYDATKLVAQALKAKGSDRRGVRDYLRSLNRETAYEGLTGPAFFEDTGDPVGIRFRVLRAHQGELTLAEAR
ncbi:MAG TPA: ABC transporter substrate-binding protein [Gemmatimonadaceae bacterium]|nr:ABC transporter substrate-binding protein [Gemmatimonadaceae bacterium]